jgi:hypothetical protein
LFIRRGGFSAEGHALIEYADRLLGAGEMVERFNADPLKGMLCLA